MHYPYIPGRDIQDGANQKTPVHFNLHELRQAHMGPLSAGFRAQGNLCVQDAEQRADAAIRDCFNQAVKETTKRRALARVGEAVVAAGAALTSIVCAVGVALNANGGEALDVILPGTFAAVSAIVAVINGVNFAEGLTENHRLTHQTVRSDNSRLPLETVQGNCLVYERARDKLNRLERRARGVRSPGVTAQKKTL